MQNIITLDLLASVSETGFSLDELVYQLSRISQDQGLPGIAVLILRLVDEMLLRRHLDGQAWPGARCCDQPALESLGLKARRIRTSIGVLKFSWRRYQCRACGKTRVPLRELLGLTPHQAKTGELEQMVVEVVTEQSYRRSSQHLKTIGRIPVPRTTAHRWVAASESDRIEPTPRRFDSLLADGTGYKRRPDASKGHDNQGQLRMAIGINKAGGVSALGTWSGTSWEQIATELGVGLEPGGRRAGLLVSDGEPGLAEALGPLADDQQRCLWHLTHELNGTMWQDHAPLPERRQMQKELAGLVKIELPAEDGEPVATKDREQVEQDVREAERGIDRFVAKLITRGYHRAADYIQQAQRRLFSYVRFWLRHGIVNPKVSSFIERLMREVGRRLKRMAFGWSERGAAKMARLILKRITDPQEWKDYWKKRLRLDGKVMFVFRGVRSAPPILGR